MRHLVLASGSPRRRAFLSALGLAFTVDAADVDESPLPGELPDDLVCRLSRIKAREAAARHPGAVVLAADTVVVLDGRMLGKPAGPGEAECMLEALRGRVHQVYTAVGVACSELVARDGEALAELGCAGEPDGAVSLLCRSDVWMREYGPEEIRAYVASGDPLDKAGSYAIQHPLFAPVARWQGCYASIMGLPLGRTATLLRAAGIVIQADVLATCESASGAGNCCLHGLPGRC